MDREELVGLVKYITDPPIEADEGDVGAMIDRFVGSIPHPGGTDLIYYPENWGLPSDLSPEGVVQAALGWKPRTLVMKVNQVRLHPRESGLRCYSVVVDGVVRTQVVAKSGIDEGAAVVVALSGCTLLDGTEVLHSFVGRAFSAGQLLGVTELPVGSDLTSIYCRIGAGC